MIVGNDISSWQGEIAWDTYKNNTNFVLIKATEGVGFTDARFYEYQQAARNRNMLIGYYHFAHPELGNTGNAEADYFLSVVGKLQEGEILALDYEANWGGDVVSWCKQFLDRIQEQTNIRPLIYLNQMLCRAYDWTPVIHADYALWIAAYTGDPQQNNFEGGKWQVAAMQQWTDAQGVPGINGNVDGDVFFGDFNAFKAYGFHQTTSTTPPAPPSSPTPPSAPIPPSTQPTDPCQEQNTRIQNLTTVNKQYNEQIVQQQQVILALQKQVWLLQHPQQPKRIIDYIVDFIHNVQKGGK